MLDYCLAKPGAWPDEPWDGDVVAKVGAKIFCFLGADSVTVKCGKGRDEADEWLARYPAEASVSPYIGRHGWNVLRLDGAIPPEEIEEAIDDSYDRIVATLPTKDRPPRS
ncbi:MAG: MmcQ/YjbR family DNA-binding protein [Austwickia sp.]|nr:MmcQ/YjbR family DNA-binding protein [Actinomycetota bacterium]MCB1255062.1 MmcQ/YjbR family DNA-binding protein [Austwickia sp.]